MTDATQITELQTFTDSSVEKLRASDEYIEAISRQADEVEVDGIDDKAGFKILVDLRKQAKNVRLKIEATRKELKRDAIDYGKVIDTEAKRLTALIQPVEQKLLDEEKRIEGLIEAEKNKAFEKKKNVLVEAGAVADDYLKRVSFGSEFINYSEIAKMNDDKIFAAVELIGTELEAVEAQKIADEEAAAEVARIAQENADLKKKLAELEQKSEPEPEEVLKIDVTETLEAEPEANDSVQSAFVSSEAALIVNDKKVELSGDEFQIVSKPEFQRSDILLQACFAMISTVLEKSALIYETSFEFENVIFTGEQLHKMIAVHLDEDLQQ